MAAPLSHRIADRVPEAAGLYHRLVLVVGQEDEKLLMYFDVATMRLGVDG